MGLLTLVVTVMVTALSVAREREAGTFDQLLVTPLCPVEILLGKALPGIVIGIVNLSLAAWLFRHRMYRGGPWATTKSLSKRHPTALFHEEYRLRTIASSTA